MPKDVNHQDIFAHFPPAISQGIVDFAQDTALLKSRYFFVRKVNDHYQSGYCTHCHQEYICGWYGSYILKHNEHWTCLHCKSECTVKSSGRGRKKLIDDAYFVYYEKSVMDPNAIVARGIYVMRDYRESYHDVTTQYRVTAMYLFKPGQAVMLHRPLYANAWTRRRALGSEFYTSMKYKDCFVAQDSVESAVRGTPFQYSCWVQYRNESPDYTRFFSEFAKYPCIEYLTKLGLRSIVTSKIYGVATRGIINWRGTNIFKVLNMSKDEVNDLRKSGVKADLTLLQTYQFFKRYGVRLTMTETEMLGDISSDYYLKELKNLLQYGSLETIIRYLLKQVRKSANKKHHYTGTGILTDWRDYLRECEELGMDLTAERVLFPNDLHTAHQKTTEKIKIKQDESLNVMIALRLDSLKQYKFVYNGLFVRPARDSIELFNEGKTLNHCVGRYAKTYAEGKTNLFFIRKIDEPNTSFYTMEIVDDKIIQVRGEGNCRPDEQVSEFIQKFTAARLMKRAKQAKMRTAAQTA